MHGSRPLATFNNYIKVNSYCFACFEKTELCIITQYHWCEDQQRDLLAGRSVGRTPQASTKCPDTHHLTQSAHTSASAEAFRSQSSTRQACAKALASCFVPGCCPPKQDSYLTEITKAPTDTSCPATSHCQHHSREKRESV